LVLLACKLIDEAAYVDGVLECLSFVLLVEVILGCEIMSGCLRLIISRSVCLALDSSWLHRCVEAIALVQIQLGVTFTEIFSGNVLLRLIGVKGISTLSCKDTFTRLSLDRVYVSVLRLLRVRDVASTNHRAELGISRDGSSASASV